MSDLANKENNHIANPFDALAQLEPDTKSESSYSRSNTMPRDEISTDGTSKQGWTQRNIQQELNMKLTPSVEQHAQEYESHFPSLGQPQDTLKPEVEFHPEILSPVNIVASQSHVGSASDSTPANEPVNEPVHQEWAHELRDPTFIEVKAHKPSGAKKEEQEEVLESEEPTEPVEPVVVQPPVAELEKSTEKPVAKPVIIQAQNIAPAKGWEELEEEPKVEEAPIEESETAPKESNLAKSNNIFNALAQLAPKMSEGAESEEALSPSNKPSEKTRAPKPVETRFVKPRVGIMVTPAVEEKTHEYESHFPILGQESTTLQPETEFKPEILSPVNLVAESIFSGDFIEVKPKARAPAKNISEEPEEIIESEEAPAITRAEPIELNRSAVIEKPVAKPAIYEAATIAPAKGWDELAKETEQKEVKIEVTADLEKKSHKYENLFPTIGEEPKDAGVETKFKTDILNPINIVVAEAHGETPKVAINPEALNAQRPKAAKPKVTFNDDMAPIEEHIEIQDDDEKPYAKNRSSLEHLHEDNVMNQSTELTLSSNRIDLIREELRESETRALSSDPIFQDIERSLIVVRDLEKGGQHGEAIKLLKKNMEILDARFMNNDKFDLREMNKLLLEINLQLAGCYHHINEIRYAIDHARAAMTFNSTSPKAIYLLGTSLIRAHNFVEGYNILKQIRRIPLPGGDGYEDLIEHELRIYERRAQEVLKDIEEPVKEKAGLSALDGIGLFVGTALSSGIVSWFVSRNSLGLSEKRSWASAIGAGTLVGGLSLMLMAHNNRK